MRPRCSVFIATSLDGYIARPDGSIDWLDAVNRLVPAGEDCGYADFAARVDGLVMGRGTFEKVAGFDAWPYGDLPVTVLSRRPVGRPPHVPAAVEVSAESPAALVERLAQAGRRHLHVDGGELIRSFLCEALIDELTITTVPVLIGEGRRLFGPGLAPLPHDIALRLLAARHWDFGFVQARYEVVRDRSP